MNIDRFFKSLRVLRGGDDEIAGGDGTSRESAVVINATSSAVGIPAEYEWIEARFGERGSAWDVHLRFHGGLPEKYYETFVIELADGTLHTIHFDITAFFGRP